MSGKSARSFSFCRFQKFQYWHNEDQVYSSFDDFSKRHGNNIKTTAVQKW